MIDNPTAPFKERLMLLQAEMKAPKTQYNKFGDYNYRSNEDILEVLKPLLPKYSMTVDQTDYVELIGERYYVKSVSTLTDIHSPESKSCTSFAREPENRKGFDASQITGASGSYSRKYSISGLLSLDDNKDADFTNKTAPGQAAPGQLVAPKEDPELPPGVTVPPGLSGIFVSKVLKDTANFFVDDQWREKLMELKKKPHFTRDHEIFFLEQWDKFTESNRQVQAMENQQ